MPMRLTALDGACVIPDSRLVVGMDETGHHSLTDRHYPVFGLAGCAVRVENLDDRLDAPWRQMKAECFGGPTTPLHAADLRPPSQRQLEALGHFFANNHFGRLAVVLTSETAGVQRYPPYHVVAGPYMTRIASFAASFSCDGVALIAEESEEGDRLVAQAFSGRGLVAKREEKEWPLPFDTYRASKRLGLPLLEVADFVAHAAGRHVAAGLRAPQGRPRKDFGAVFELEPRDLAKFMAIEWIAPAAT